ncbi:hypothetical protein EJ06DRAFT_554365 [Trichodelitschia bisporula]|uniref:SET domain-containing protein n=1 Tax=Trichodelitschia bisporula TaxID=703511 RepID=A0A6G1I409_9PEZI|nr:hypothetical protein EJ06DRAFT_554365 [Trichodelitschia bisporula]
MSRAPQPEAAPAPKVARKTARNVPAPSGIDSDSEPISKRRRMNAFPSIHSSSPPLPDDLFEPDPPTMPIPPTFEATQALLKSHFDMIHGRRETRTRLLLKQARAVSSAPADVTPDYSTSRNAMEESSVVGVPWYAAIKPIHTEGPCPSGKKDVGAITQEWYPEKSKPNKWVKTVLEAPITRVKCDAVDLPRYTTYVSLDRNILAENNKKLICWPYFDDDETQEKVEEMLRVSLRQHYKMLYEKRPRHLAVLHEVAHFREIADAFLKDLGITYHDVLHFLLEPDLGLPPNLLSLDDIHHWTRREEYCKDSFDRDHPVWKKVFANLPPSSPRSLVVAAFACSAFLEGTPLGLWHIVRKSAVVEKILAPKPEETLDTLECAICHIRDCPYHGEFMEREPTPDSDEESSVSSCYGSAGLSDYDSASNCNFKRCVLPPAIDSRPKGPRRRESGPTADPKSKPDRSFAWWQKHSKTNVLEMRGPFYPCDHPGISCEESHCSCFNASIQCEKFCGCDKSCARRALGCTCKRDGRSCYRNPKCPCWVLNRECNPDLCTSCGAAEVLDPENVNRDERWLSSRCHNCYIQRNIPKRTLLGTSQVAGFGLFAGTDIKAHEYIGEYKGEILTRQEGNRRGEIYHYQKTNYLFMLNEQQDIDSMSMGNKTRFINHQADDENINCGAKPYLCNTVVRMGMYALRDIKLGEELFFNYGDGYTNEHTRHFTERGRKKGGKAVAVKDRKGKSKMKGIKSVSKSGRKSAPENLDIVSDLPSQDPAFEEELQEIAERIGEGDSDYAASDDMRRHLRQYRRKPTRYGDLEEDLQTVPRRGQPS